MSDEPQPGMSEDFKARMRQGLSSMAVRERVRERRRNRAIASGVVAAVTAVVLGVGVWQVAGSIDPRMDQAAPVPTSTIAPSAEPTPTPAPTSSTAAVPTETAAPEPTPPPGFEGVASGVPIVTDFVDCSAGCGDAGAAGGPTVERVFDVYVLCEGSGSVLYGGAEWIDCAEHEPGSGWAVLDAMDVVGDGDPRYTSSPDFDGRLQVVDAGAAPTGEVVGDTATVYYDCGPSVTIGGVLFDCSDPAIIPDLAAWGIPIEPGWFAPRIEFAPGEPRLPVRWVMER
ncbi:MAG: hypothetical protein ACQEWM_12500 [Actinomycetota bacterium]